MPKERRRSAGGSGDGDIRPSFARPPGGGTGGASARPTPPSSFPTQQTTSPNRRRSSSRNSRRNSIVHTSDEDSWSDLERRRSGQPTARRRSSSQQQQQRSKPKPRPTTAERDPSKTTKQRRPSRDADNSSLYEWRRSKNPERTSHKRKTSEAPVSYDPRDKQRDRAKYTSGSSTNSGTQLLSSDALGKLNAKNDLADFDAKRKARKKREKEYEQLRKETKTKSSPKKNRNVSGAILEEGRSKKKRKTAMVDYNSEDEYNEKHQHKQTKQPMSKKKKKWLIIGAGIVVALLIIVIAAVVASKNKSKGGGGGGGGGSSNTNTNPAAPTNTCSGSDMPASAKGTYYDVTTWLDTTDFNCTYTDETVGGLPVMGLFTKYDDSAQANANTPPLNKPWSYGKMPFRGTNVGGWLNLEPFITPSMFNFPASANIVDEWTLSQQLGSSANRTLEQHYATFITKSDFQAIANAGLDHVRIPFGYWAVRVYSGDPYVAQISWRYLLRAIEYCREFGLRVNLDLHGVPGSQNGWAHSGHQGTINWLNGPDGDTNGQRSLDIHDQLSQFFAQDRYKNVVAMYGLVNEPKMINMDDPSKVITWNGNAIALVRNNGITQQIIFGDGFEALDTWNNTMKSYVDQDCMLDTHQYQIFNVGQLKLSHTDKINLACSGWTGLITASNNPQTGWGPTLNGEWSQADTDCTPNLNNVGAGSRWAGNLDTNTGAGAVNVNTPSCASPPCQCAPANADPSTYSSDYKQWLKMYAEAQMHSFETGQGWFYWTWATESAAQWSYKTALANGLMPSKAYSPDFQCDSTVPSFSGLGDSY